MYSRSISEEFWTPTRVCHMHIWRLITKVYYGPASPRFGGGARRRHTSQPLNPHPHTDFHETVVIYSPAKSEAEVWINNGGGGWTSCLWPVHAPVKPGKNAIPRRALWRHKICHLMECFELCERSWKIIRSLSAEGKTAAPPTGWNERTLIEANAPWPRALTLTAKVPVLSDVPVQRSSWCGAGAENDGGGDDEEGSHRGVLVVSRARSRRCS